VSPLSLGPTRVPPHVNLAKRLGLAAQRADAHHMVRDDPYAGADELAVLLEAMLAERAGRAAFERIQRDLDEAFAPGRAPHSPA
jgi:hypothetical protein